MHTPVHTHVLCVPNAGDTPCVCVCVHAQRPTSTDGVVASLASRRASADKVEDAVLDMLEDLGRIQADFDPVGWMKLATCLPRVHDVLLAPDVFFEMVCVCVEKIPTSFPLNETLLL